MTPRHTDASTSGDYPIKSLQRAMSGVDFRSIYSNERAGDYLEFLEILSTPLPNDAIMIQESKLCQGKGCAVFLLIQPDSLCIFSQKGP